MLIIMMHPEEGPGTPINIAATHTEAIELIQSDLKSRHQRLLKGQDPGECPFEYQVWGQERHGYQLHHVYPAQMVAAR